MSEEVMPQFERLMEDKANFDRYKELSEQIQEKQRLYLAYDYSQLKAQVNDKDGTQQKQLTDLDQKRARIEKLM